MTTLETTPFAIGDKITINLPSRNNRYSDYSFYQTLTLIAQTDKAYQFKLDNTNYTLWLPKKAVIQMDSQHFNCDTLPVELKQSKLAHWFAPNDYQVKILYSFGHIISFH